VEGGGGGGQVEQNLKFLPHNVYYQLQFYAKWHIIILRKTLQRYYKMRDLLFRGVRPPHTSGK